MSYSIIRVQKMKGPAIKGIQIHNQREKDSETNPDIRKEDFQLNYDLIHGQEKIDYKQEIHQVISENVKSEKKIRKDAVLVSEFLITSDTTFFDNLSPDEQKRYFETAKDFIADRYGQQNVIYATVHNDEKTPHMHVGIVPVTEDGRLSAKEVIGNRMDLVKLQDAFNVHVKAHGFDLERGLSSSRKHQEMAKFKQLTAHKDEKEAMANYEQTVSKIKAIGEKTKALEDVPNPAKAMGRVIMKSEDYETLVNYATTGVVAEIEVVDLQQKLAQKEQEVVQLKEEMKIGQEKIRKSYKEIEKENVEIQANLDKIVDEKTKEFLRENEIMLKYQKATKNTAEMETKYNQVAKYYNTLMDRSTKEKDDFKAEKEILLTKNQALKEENGQLHRQLQNLQKELEIWKARLTQTLRKQFDRIKTVLSREIRPDQLVFLEKSKEKIVESSLREMEKPKQHKKEQEMER